MPGPGAAQLEPHRVTVVLDCPAGDVQALGNLLLREVLRQ